MACIPALMTLALPESGRQRGHNGLLLMYFLVVVQASDVLQYLWGKWLGRHPIAPAISPSKTVEGFTGGIICATLLGASLWRLTPFTLLEAAGVSLMITLLGFAGGLVLSAEKRARGIKDWGRLIPGHGGLLDRVDSLWLAAPPFYWWVRVCHT
jgi:phosphatidate cytidylyltransferase